MIRKIEKNIHKYKKWVKIFSIIGTILFSTGGLLFLYSRPLVDKGIPDHPENYKYHIAMISTDYTDQFWDSFYDEIKTAGKERGIYIEKFGENLTGDYTEKDLMEMAVSAKVDGILLNTESPKEMEMYIHEAYEAGIPVMTILNDVTNSERIGFISCDNYAMGEMFGNQIQVEAQRRLEKFPEKENIKVTLLVSSKEENTSANIILSRIREVLEILKKQVDLEVVVSDDDIFDSEENAYEILLGTDTPDIVACLGTVDTVSVYQSVVEYNKVGEVTIIGYYFSEDILDGIEKGIIKSTVSIDTKKMGETAIGAWYQYLEKSYVSEYLPVSVELITADNAEQYRRKEE